MKAFKVFNEDWTCRGFKFEVGKEYFQEGEIVLCRNGFHACKLAKDCFSYYSFDPKNKVAEVELFGAVRGENEDKSCASNIKIIREIKWEELLTIINTGKGCSGLWNSGDRNSGNRNSGNRNSGDSNSGDRNSGDRNSGDWNSGDSNSGDWNSGDRNSGYSNSGDWNSGDRNSGYFNSNKPKVRIFNKETDYDDIDFPAFLYFNLNQWISHDTATEKEKEKYKNEIETCGGFLKTIDYKTAFKRAWENAVETDREKVKSLPNFDADIFYEISGIEV